MKFSIITPSYNQGAYIAQNIESVLAQQWPEVEHIVVDGGSKDDTVDVLKRYPHLTWVSEPDEGQADALNKGLRLVSGDIVGWVNSDDYYQPDAFRAVAECFEDPRVQWVIGDIALFEEATGKLVPMSAPEVSFDRLVANPDIVRQQGTFFRREFLLRAGGWNKAYYMVMDFDLWIRLARQSAPVMLSRQLAVFRIQKEQKSSHATLLRQTGEMCEVLKRENAPALAVLRLKLKKHWYWLKGVAKTFLVRLGVLDREYLHRPYRGWRSN